MENCLSDSLDNLMPVFCRLGADDAEELAALEQTSFSSAWGSEEFTAALGQSSFHAYGVRVSGELVAYISTYVCFDELEIVNIAVLPPFRRKRLAYRLMRYVFEVECADGVKKAFLEVRSGNSAAISLYAHFGFKRVHVRKKYYADNGEDAFVFAANFLVKREKYEKNNCGKLENE